MHDDLVTYFAETDARNKRVKFGIKAKDRTRHVYVIGKTGMGKSTLLENMAVQDIQNGEGMAFIDPHGKTADLLMEYIPKDRIQDVIYIAPFDTEYPISFNVLESVDPGKRHLVVGGLMSTFKKIWVDAWSARMEYILTNTLLALLEYPSATLLGVNRMLSDKEYRKDVVSHITDPSVKTFWVKEFAGYTERMAAEAVPAIQNKVGQFTANPLIRNMIGQSKSSFDFREAMDQRKIIIINLSKGRIGDENMKLLGGLLVTKIYLAAMSRADVPDRVMKMLPNFYLFVDEFQNFANASFADILSEARKYKLNLTIAHQYVEQMDEIVRPAVFGNVGTMIAFRVGATDGELLEKEFAPQFTVEDLVNLGFAQIYMKLMIDGLSSAPFSATTLPPIPHPEKSYVTDIIDASRKQFSRPRSEVEAEIIKFHEQSGKPIPKPADPNAPAASAPKPSTPQPPRNLAAIEIKPTFSPGVTAEMLKNEQKQNSAHSPASQKAQQQQVNQPQKTIQTQPQPKPAETHKPFNNLKDILNTVTANSQKENDTTKKVTDSSSDADKPADSNQSKVQSAPKQSQPNPVPQPTPKPQPIAVAPKPVSLSELQPRSSGSAQKVDPKMPSAKNVADLKNALAAVLAQNKSNSSAANSSVSIPNKTEANQPLQQENSNTNTQNTSSKADSNKSFEQKPKSVQSVDSGDVVEREVKEDVLKKILDMG